ncbi:MAG: rod shape-determining protein MreD [Nitrospirota bacterium]
MTYLLWAVIILFTFIIQGRVSLFDVSPNFTSVLAYYAGVRKGELGGIFLGSFIGVIEDSLSGTFLGPNLLSKGLVGYFSSFMSGSFFRWTPFLGAIAISALTLIDDTLVFMSRSFFDKMPTSIQAAVFIGAVQSLINTPLGIFLRPKETQ